jgi:hypothetical protein
MKLVKRYGYGLDQFPIRDSRAWLEMPTCLVEADEREDANGAQSTEESGVSESIDGVYEYTSPVSGDAKWIAGYRCRLCYNGRFISVVGHHIVAPGYEDRPWTHVAEKDFASPDLSNLVEHQIQLLFEKIP